MPISDPFGSVEEIKDTPVEAKPSDPFGTVEEVPYESISDPYKPPVSGIVDPFTEKPEEEKQVSPLLDFSDRARKQFQDAGLYDVSKEKEFVDSVSKSYDDWKGYFGDVVSGDPVKAISAVGKIASESADNLYNVGHEIVAAVNTGLALPVAATAGAFAALGSMSTKQGQEVFKDVDESLTFVKPSTPALETAFDIISKGVGYGVMTPSIGLAEASNAWKKITGKTMSQDDYDDISRAGQFAGTLASILIPGAKGIRDYVKSKSEDTPKESDIDTILKDAPESTKEELPVDERPPVEDRYNALSEEQKAIVDPFRQTDTPADKVEETPTSQPVEDNQDNTTSIDGLKGLRKKQGGAVDPGVFAEAFAKLFGVHEESKIDENHSGESPASTEAVNRLKSQNDAGIKQYQIDPRTNEVTPLNTVDRVDQKAPEGKAIVQMDKDGEVTVIDNKSDFKTEGLINRSKYQINKGFGGKQSGAIDLGIFNKDKPEQSLTESAKTDTFEEWQPKFAKMYPGKDISTAQFVYNKINPTSVEQAKVPDFSISPNVKDWDYRGKQDERAIMQGTNFIKKLAPTKEEREALTKDLDEGTNKDSPAVQKVRTLFDEVFNIAHENGVVGSYVEDYITHIYDFGKQHGSKTLKALQDLTDQTVRNYSPGMGKKSPFARERIFKTLAEAAKEKGLVPLTTDTADIFQIYAGSMLRAVNNKKLIEELRDIKDPDTGYKMIIKQPEGKQPKDYVFVDHPQFVGQMVHKDVAPTIKSMFQNYDPSMITRAAHAASILAKKGIFSLSAFHIKSLADGFLGVMRNPKSTFKIPSLMKEWKSGQAGDLVDQLLKGGLEIGHQTLDTHDSVWSAVVKDGGNLLDKVFPGFGQSVRLPAKVIDGLNKFLWEYVHPSFKLATASQEYARLIAKGVEKDKAAEMASTFTNDIFGGLNWRRMAENASTGLGYKLANEAASKRGKMGMQIAALAPDWTVATARSWLGAIRKGVPPEERAMYQKYLLQSALVYAIAADGLNLHFTGHHFWENDDPTAVDLGDGRKMMISKHFMEMIHWMEKPNQVLLNKMGSVPREIMTQALNVDYLSPKGSPAMVTHKQTFKDSPAKYMIEELKPRIAHILKGFTPITGRAFSEQSPTSAAAGFIGFPIYGKTNEEKMDAKMKRLMNKMDD